ncbi:BON domain-containing protein [Chitinispirillales bacterium ANBcel5]|uniref:BON domain-containing protein n=1 Tax=Cellulosispirillum alkaliphilum TaxID=3039283 RepID=UPI002A58AD8A|nr:BON domain-containing protein [Chitinispirillales bacterium ANBcel5]
MEHSERVKKTIVDKLALDSRVDSSNVIVELRDGKVRLGGTVPDYHAKEAAYEDAITAEDVKEVENEIVVFPTAAPPVPSDIQLATRVKNILEWNVIVDPSDIEVEVDEGVVTLRGSVSSLWRKNRAQSLISVLKGVLGVSNKLVVVPTENHSDMALADSVISAFERDPSINPESLTVKVEHGVVTLRGEVPAWPVKKEALRIASHTGGVLEVNNEIRVVP